MTEKDKHWEANDLINKGIYEIQLSIEEYKSDIKKLQRGMNLGGLTESGAIHGLTGLRKELEIFEYMQSLLDLAATEKSTVESIQDYLNRTNKN